MIEKRNEVMVNALLEAGADTSKEDKDGANILHLLSEWGNEPIIDLLLKRGFDPMAQTKFHKTCVDIANEHNHPEIAAKLEEYHFSKQEEPRLPRPSLPEY